MILPWGPSVYPVALDSAAYPTLIDNVHEVIASHPNSLAAAVLAIEDKLAITNGVATGFGGLSFYTTGKAANPGGAGNPTLWVDNSGGAGFHIMYTDELGVDHDLISAAGITDLQDAYDGGPTIVVAGTNPVYIDSGLLSNTVLLSLRQNDSTNLPDCIVIENNTDNNLTGDYLEDGRTLYIYGSADTYNSIVSDLVTYITVREAGLAAQSFATTGTSDAIVELLAVQDSDSRSSRILLDSYCTDLGCLLDSLIVLDSHNYGLGDSVNTWYGTSDGGDAYIDIRSLATLGVSSTNIQAGTEAYVSLYSSGAVGYFSIDSYYGDSSVIAHDGEMGVGSLAANAYNSLAEFISIASGTGTSTASLYSKAAADTSTLTIYSESTTLGNAILDLYCTSNSDGLLSIYSQAENISTISLEVQDVGSVVCSSLLLTQINVGGVGSGYFELQASGVGEWSLVEQYEGWLFVGTVCTGANAGCCDIFSGADAEAYTSIIAVSGSAQGYVALGYDFMFGLPMADFLVFSDNNNPGSTWVAEYMLFSAGSAEWDTFKANFGEVSLLNAINQAAGGGGGSLQVSYGLGNTIDVAGVLPVYISCADEAGSILLSLENNDITNNFHCMTIENNANSGGNIYTNAHSINLSGSNGYHQIVDSISSMTADFSVYAYTTGLEGSTLTSTFGIVSDNDDEDSGANILTSYFQTYSNAIYDDGEGQGPTIYSYFRSIYDDTINGPDANVITHTYLSSIGSGGFSDIWIEATSGQSEIYIIATSDGVVGEGDDDSFVQVEALASAGQATTTVLAVGVSSFTYFGSVGSSDSITYVDSWLIGDTGYIAIGTRYNAYIDIKASGVGSILNLSSEDDAACYVHLWSWNSDVALNSEVRIGANSDFSQHSGIITFCDDNLIEDGSFVNFVYLSSASGDWYNFYTAYETSSLVSGLAKARTDIPVNIPIVGTHTGANNAAVLTDATKAWIEDALIGRGLANTTDGSSTTITDNDATTATGVLGGGAENDWDTGDAYTVTTETLLGAKSGQMYTNEAATADITLTLPAAVANRNFQFYVKTNKYLKIQANAGDVIWIAGSNTAAAGYIRSTTIGNAVKLVAINSTDWVAVSVVGTWSLDS